MARDFRQLLEEIAQCPIATAIRCGESPPGAPCQKIVRLQTEISYQLPEPWSGNIDTAPILFVSSNPSIDESEKYPDQSWNLDKTVDFFQNRFTSTAGWVDDRLRVLRRDDSRSRFVSFWASARSRASEALEKRRTETAPGIDFALTEVVQSKSREEEGVREAVDFCSARYLEKVLSASAASLVIVYGELGQEAVCRYFGSVGDLSLVSMGGAPRMLAFLPHPNQRGSKKSLEANFGHDGLSLIRAHLKGDKDHGAI